MSTITRAIVASFGLLAIGAQAQQAAEVFHAPMGLAVFVHVKAVHHQRLAVV